MEIVKNQIDDLNAELIIKIAPEDYQEKVDKTLADYKKQANIPGFRPGKVPMGMIRKRFGKSVLADELNKVLNQSIYEYIQKNDLDVLGNPLPSEDKEVKGDWDQPKEFEFIYEMGLAPNFDLKLNNKSKFPYYKVKIDKEMVDRQMDDLRRRYGKLSEAEKASEGDMIMGQFVELDEEGNIKEGGIMNSSTVSIEFVEDEKVQKQLIGLKVGDQIKVDPRKLSKGAKDLASMLNISEEQAASISGEFQMTVNEIKHMEKAELNQEFYDKLFGKDEIKSEKEFRERMEKDLEQMFEKDSKRILSRDVTDSLIEKTKIDLPDEFLKRWILASAKDEELTREKVDADYENYRNNLKWQLIQNRIIKENELEAGQDEVMAYTKQMMASQYAQYGMPAPDDKELEETAQKLLSNQEQANGIYEQIYDQKLTEFYSNTVKLNEKKVSYDEFVEIAQGNKKK